MRQLVKFSHRETELHAVKQENLTTVARVLPGGSALLLAGTGVNLLIDGATTLKVDRTLPPQAWGWLLALTVSQAYPNYGPAAVAAGRVAQLVRPFGGRECPPRKVRGLGRR